jgi:hypothetical protein
MISGLLTLPLEMPPELQVQVINTRYYNLLYDKFKEGTPSQNRSFACCSVSVFATAQVPNPPKKIPGTIFLKSNYTSLLSYEV